MLQAIPKRWYSWDFAVMDGPRPLADIDMSRWREKGALTIDGVNYGVRREGLLHGDFVLESAGSVVARAERPSVFQRAFVIKHNDRHYTLRRQSVFGRGFVLSRGATVLGTIAPQGVFSRRLAIDLPDDVPRPVQVFAVWLALLLWRRRKRAAAS